MNKNTTATPEEHRWGFYAAILAGFLLLSMIGNALVNALIPPPKPSFDVNSSADASPVAAPRYQLTGDRKSVV